MGWPFEVFDMKPGSLHEVRASCTFARCRDEEEKHQVDFIPVSKGTILMSLGYEEVHDELATHHFKFLHGEQIIFLPITVHPEDYETEEEMMEEIQISLYAFVKPTSHGFTMSSRSPATKPYLIGDSRDDDGYDEFH